LRPLAPGRLQKLVPAGYTGPMIVRFIRGKASMRFEFLGCFQFLISALGGIIVTNLPCSGPVAMAVMIAACMGVIPLIRWLGKP